MMHTLYRFYGANDSLLYVGITINPGRRLERHRDTKDWWLEVARVTMEQHPDKVALLAAERAAIKAEKPVYNIRMNDLREHPAPQPVGGALPKGLTTGHVYAFGLVDGTCPVGLIVSGDEDGIVIAPYSWMLELFSLPDEWIAIDEIRRWRRAEREEEADRTVFHMDPLGDFQGDWTSFARGWEA